AVLAGGDLVAVSGEFPCRVEPVEVDLLLFLGEAEELLALGAGDSAGGCGGLHGVGSFRVVVTSSIVTLALHVKGDREGSSPPIPLPEVAETVLDSGVI